MVWQAGNLAPAPALRGGARPAHMRDCARRENDYNLGTMNWRRVAKFAIGDIVHHRLYPFRGVVFDIDPAFNNTEEWWQAIPAEVRPRKDQPFYHLLAENDQTTYVAYVSEQNLEPDQTGKPCRHPAITDHFTRYEAGHYIPRPRQLN